MKRIGWLIGCLLLNLGCDRQADVGVLPLGAVCTASRECAAELVCASGLCAKEGSRDVLAPQGGAETSVNAVDGGTPQTGNLAVTHLSARLVKRYLCRAGVSAEPLNPSAIECGDYEVSFSLTNGTSSWTDRLAHFELNIGAVRLVRNDACTGVPWQVPPGGQSDIVTLRFWYSAESMGTGADTEAALAYPCGGARQPESFDHEGFPPVVRSGDVTLTASVLLETAERKDATAAVALRDDT